MTQSSETGLAFLCGASLVRVARNLATGFTVPAGVLVLWPGIGWEQTVATLFSLDLFWLALLLAEPVFGRSLDKPKLTPELAASRLLIGSSFAAFLWQPHGGTPLALAILACFLLRWGLYIAECLRIRRLDLEKISLPPPSARIRLGITWITGALIPLMVLMDLSARPLLLLSFLLTAFAQWSAGCESIVEIRKSGGISI